MNFNFEITEKKLLFFGDILGFSNMVKSPHKEENALTCNVRTFYRDFIYKTQQCKQHGVDIILFSDSIIIIASKETIENFLTDIAWFYNQYLCMGMLMRGGISYNGLKYDLDCSYLVGEAQVDAVSLEKIADYPRIILSPQAADILCNSEYITQNLVNGYQDEYYAFDVLKKYLDDLTAKKNDKLSYMTSPLSVWTTTLTDYAKTATDNHQKQKLKYFQSYLLRIQESFQISSKNITAEMIRNIQID